MSTAFSWSVQIDFVQGSKYEKLSNQNIKKATLLNLANMLHPQWLQEMKADRPGPFVGVKLNSIWTVTQFL